MDLITEHLDIWTSAQIPKTNGGRGHGKEANGKTIHGIKKLRELILELAVRGKLVPQDPEDEPARVLLKRIVEEKTRLVKEGKIKKQKGLSKVKDDEAAFKLPSGWEWARFQDVSSYIQRGKGPKYADCGRVSVISQKCIQWSGFDLSPARHVNDESLGAYHPERFLQQYDLLWNSTGTGTVGRINVLQGEVKSNVLVADSHVTVIRPLNVDSRFLWCYVAAPGVQLRINPSSENSLVSGTTQQVELNTSAVVALPLPVPPLAEQQRIVAKVDELMALCDKLEQQQTDSSATHQTLVETLLTTLTNAADQTEFVETWQGIADNFDILFTNEQSIDHLKQTILQLAVMGKLVSQAPDDEPASVLLEKIAKEKAQLFKKGEIKKQQELSEIEVKEKAFRIPDEWEWARIVDICSLITDGTHQTPTYTESGRIFISAQNVKPFKFMPENHRWVSEEDYQGYIKNRKPEMGDILLTRVGAGIGEAAVIDTNLEFAIYVSVGLLKPFKDYINPEYLLIWLNSPLGRRHSEKNTYGKGVSQGNLNLSLIRNFVVSIPPFSEQHRIVTKVDELMNLCDSLKTHLSKAQTTQFHLADTIVEQAVSQETVQQ